MQIAFLDVNLRAALGKRALRFEPLGTDLDGRIYYCLTPRSIEVDGGRPPQAWASGLLVWGRGVPALPGTDEELPEETERWSHFGKSASMHQLIKWLEWTFKKAVEALKPPKPSATPKKALATPAKQGSATKSSIKKTKTYAASAPRPTLVQSTLFTNSSATPKSVPKFELVLPMSAGRARAMQGTTSIPKFKSSASARVKPVASSKEETQSDKLSSSSSSALSEISNNPVEDLQSLLHPEGYKPKAATIEEQGRDLLLRLREVATWLEVLEWKGMGEVR